MNKTIHFLSLLLLLSTGCTDNSNPGTEIVFTDVLGSYEGSCAEWDIMENKLLEKEVGELSIFAKNSETIGFTATCDRIGAGELTLLSASASEIIFTRDSSNYTLSMTYLTVPDSISLLWTYTDNLESRIVFRGTRK